MCRTMTTSPPHDSTDSLLYGEDSVEYSDDQSLYTMHGGNLYVGQDNMEYDDSTELSTGVYGDIKEQNDGLEEEYISNFTFLSSKGEVLNRALKLKKKSPDCCVNFACAVRAKPT